MLEFGWLELLLNGFFFFTIKKRINQINLNNWVLGTH